MGFGEPQCVRAQKVLWLGGAVRWRKDPKGALSFIQALPGITTKIRSLYSRERELPGLRPCNIRYKAFPVALSEKPVVLRCI